MNKHLHDVLEVIEISDLLHIEVACTVGHLHRFWSFVDDNSVDGRISLSEGQVDKLTRPGFATALLLVGWLHGESRGYTVPNFERYNPNPAKGRNVPQAHRTPAPFKFNPSEAHGLQSPANYRYKIKDSKTGRFAKNGASQSGIHLPHADGFGAEFLAPHPGGSGAEPGAQPGESPVNSPVKITGDSPGSSPGDPSIHAGSSGLALVQYSTRRDRRKEMYWEGGTCTASPPDFSFFAKIAVAKNISMDFAKLFYTGLEASNFKDSNGQGIQNYAGYFVASAKRWTNHEPTSRVNPHRPAWKNQSKPGKSKRIWRRWKVD